MIDSMSFHHLGIACENIPITASHYERAGYAWDGKEVIDPLQNIRIAFLTHPAMPMIELLAPVDDNSPIIDILHKNGTTPYHICYFVPDVKYAIKELRAQKYVLISKPQKASAIEGHCVAFLYHKDVGLIELVGMSIN